MPVTCAGGAYRQHECSSHGMQLLARHSSFRSAAHCSLCKGRGHPLAGGAGPAEPSSCLWGQCCCCLAGDLARPRLPCESIGAHKKKGHALLPVQAQLTGTLSCAALAVLLEDLCRIYHNCGKYVCPQRHRQAMDVPVLA